MTKFSLEETLFARSPQAAAGPSGHSLAQACGDDHSGEVKTRLKRPASPFFRLCLQIAIIALFHPIVLQGQPIRHAVEIPHSSFVYALTNKANLPPNFPMLGFDKAEGLLLWVWKPAPTNWVVESSADLRNWRIERVFYNDYANEDPIKLRAGGQAVSYPRELRFFRARMSPDLQTEASKRWRQSAITNYTFEYSYSCFCNNGISGTVTVRDGKAVSVTNAVHNAVSGPTDPVPPDLAQFPTIDKLLETRSAGFYAMILDPVYGYPMVIIIGMPENDAGATITVRNLTPIQ